MRKMRVPSPSAVHPMPASQISRLVDMACERAERLIDEQRPAREALALLVGAAEAVAPNGSAASILVIDRDGLLRNAASPNLPGDYLSAIDRLRPDPAVGTCAAAAATGHVVVTRSFLSDAHWAELRHLPLALGFRSAWSQPILASDQRVVGTFGTYFVDERVPSDLEQKAVQRLAQVAARALEADANRP